MIPRFAYADEVFAMYCQHVAIGLLVSNPLHSASIELFISAPLYYPLCTVYVSTLPVNIHQVPWSEVVSNIANMTDKMDNFAARCKKLPGRLKQWDAFTQLR